MYDEVFPSRMKKARNNTGFTQREVAKETGISQPNIARYELGTLQPDFPGISAVDKNTHTANAPNTHSVSFSRNTSIKLPSFQRP